MGVLDNPRQERFCQLRALGYNLRECYVRAGYRGKDPEAQASEIWKNRKLRDRVSELLQEGARDIGRVMVEMRARVIEELWENLDRSKSFVAVDRKGNSFPQPNVVAINQTLKILGESISMFPKETRLKTGQIDPYEGRTEAELLEYVVRGLEKLGVDVDRHFLARALGLDRTPTPGPDGRRIEGIGARALSPGPEAASDARSRGELPPAAADGGQPAGQEHGRLGGNGHAPDGPLPSGLEGASVPEAHPSLGGWRYDGDDP
jgi:hypothetical protein